MILRTDQVTEMQDAAARRFIERLRIALTARYPHMLPCFPVPIQRKIVARMLSRSSSHGITWQSAHARFAELMLAVAPNFDEQEQIRALLKAPGDRIDRVVLELPRLVKPSSWSSARGQAHDLPFFLTSEEMQLEPGARAERARALVLWDRPGTEHPSAAPLAAELGFSEVPDGPLVSAVWRELYGPRFRDESRYPWTADILRRRSARARLAMLKLRIALDHGRFV